MSGWIVYGSDGVTEKCRVERLEYSGEFMGACSVSVSLSSPTPVVFGIGDFIVYRGERFELNYDPSVGKASSAGGYGESFVYENVVFNSLSDELTRCDFLDYVPDDNLVHYSALPTFSFFAESVDVLAERIQVNLDRIYTGDKKWTVSVHSEYKGKTDQFVSVSNMTVWDALSLVNSQFNATFVVRGRTITIGTSGIAVGGIFSYGEGNGLTGIERNAESEQKIVTRLRAYGSTRNMPSDYYHRKGEGVLPNNMAVRHLMLPDFPDVTQDPYIDSDNAEVLGVREGSVFFDGSSGLEEIYPSMEGMTAEDLKEAGISVDAEGALDVVVSADEIGDDGKFEDGAEIAAFRVVLKDVGFDLNDYLGTSTATLSMKDGMCGGRDFEIVKCEKSGNGYVLTCDRAYDEALDLYFPYSDFQIRGGDKFVFIGIEMPDVYVEAASQRLLKAAKAYLAKNDYVRYSYSPTVDNLYLARQHDEAVDNGETSIHDTIKEGDLMLFEDSDMGVSGSVRIDMLVIREHMDSSLIPEYEITLKDEKSVGTIQKIQNQITSILNGGAGLNTEQAESLIDAYGSKKFLRKDRDDSTPYSLGVGKDLSVGGNATIGGDADVTGEVRAGGKTTVKKGLQIGETYIPGILTGTGGYFDEYANGEVERLTIRRELRVPSIVFNQVEVLVGDKWRSPGAGVIERVEPDYNADGTIGNTGTLWLKLEEGQIGAVFDNAICMGIFHDFGNPANNATADMDDSRGNRTFAGFTTSYFTITEISDYTDENGVIWHNKQCRYQIRPVSERWSGQAHPYEQMNFTCYGIFTDNEELLKKYGTSVYETRTYTRMLFKQNTWEIGAANLAMQYGDLSNMSIHGYEMDGYSIFLNNIYLTGIYKQVNAQGDPILTANERGKWISGQMYYYYDRVSHNGSLWLCINESGTNTEPSKTDASWLLEVASGSSVTAAGRWESSKVPYAMNSIVTFVDKVWISNKETSEPPFGIFLDGDSSRLTYKDGSYVLVDTLVQSDDWNLLLDAPQLTNGEDGKSVQLRYSSDKQNWHDTFVEGDIWMQQRVGDDTLWSDPIRITGESGAAGKDGTYHDYQFAVNDSLTIAPATGWQDTPPSVGIGQYLWMRTRFVDPNSATQNAWSVVRIGGEKGRGVEDVIEYYQVSASDTVPPTEWVQGQMPQMTETLKYLWNYEVIKYTDTEEVLTTPVVIGMYSKDGNGIVSVVEYYGLTDNPDTEPTKWYTDMLIPTQDVPYLWNKVITTYTEGEAKPIVRIIAVHGEKGDSITAVGEWKTGLSVPSLGVVTMYGNSYLSKSETSNPPMWTFTDADGSRLVFSANEYILTGEENNNEYELLAKSGKDGSDGRDYEYVYIHTTDYVRPATPASVQADDYIPSGWHDDPMGASESLPYEWVSLRSKKDGLWGKFTTPSLWNKWAYDAIVADIDNEMDNVALDSEGKTVSSTSIQLTASMYYGSQKQSLTAISVGSVTGISSSYNLTTGVVTLVVSKGASLGERTEIPVTISAVINGKTQTRKLVFILAGIKGGADGADAVLYDIVTSASSIVLRKDGTYDVTSVSATRTKTVGGVTTEATEGILKYSIDGGAEKEISNNSPVSSSLVTSSVKFSLYDSDGRLLDRESVPLIKDGEDGVGINSTTVSYGRSESSSVMPTTWYTTLPDVGEGECLWTRTIIDYTDEDKEDTVSYTFSYQGKTGEAGTSIKVSSIQYQVGTSATVAPTGTWSNTIVEAPQGQYLWTKTTFSDGSVAYGVTRQAKDGVSINSVTISYAKSTTNSIPTSGWQNTMPTVGEGEYLWTRTITDYTDSSVVDTVTYTYSYQGKSGQAGTSVSVVAIEYQQGDSPTTPPTGTWSSSMVEVEQGKYLWTRTTFSEGEPAYGVSRQAEDGADGVGIKSVTTTYGKSSSASSIPTSWSSTIPSVGEGEYLWTRTITDYTDDSIQDTVTYTYSYQGKTGQAGTSVSVKSIQYQAGASPTTEPTGTWSNDIVSVPQGQYLWTKTTFSDGNVAYGVSRQPEDGVDGEGFTMMGNWITGLVVPKMGVVTMKSGTYAAKAETSNPPYWCWTDKDGNRFIFSAGEYILTGEYNSEYQVFAEGEKGEQGEPGKNGEQGERGEKGEQGEKGDKGDTGARGAIGYTGCVTRAWTGYESSRKYRNDTNAEDSELESSGIRYQDILLIEVSADELNTYPSGYAPYECVKTNQGGGNPHDLSYNSSSQISTNGYWRRMSESSSLYVPKLLAVNAHLKFASSGQMVILDENQTPCAGMTGSQDGDKTRIWAGGEDPNTAPFAVNQSGTATASKFRTARSGLRLEAENGIISVFGNFAKNIEFGVNDEGMAVMRYYDNDGLLLYDLGPTGISSVERASDSWNEVILAYVGSSVSDVFGSTYWSTVKAPYDSKGATRYQFLSGYIGGVFNDAINNRRYFKSEEVKTDNYITDGWYVKTIGSSASPSEIMQWMPTSGASKPSDMNASNPAISTSSPVYMMSVMHIELGGVTESMNVYFN